MSIECEVLYALWSLYQNNLISLEQKGMIKDMLIRNDCLLIAHIKQCETQIILQYRLLELLNDQDSPRNSSCMSPLKRMISTSTVHSRQRIKSDIHRLDSSKVVLQKTRSNSLIGI